MKRLSALRVEAVEARARVVLVIHRLEAMGGRGVGELTLPPFECGCCPYACSSSSALATS
jgi:hypothetical protein